MARLRLFKWLKRFDAIQARTAKSKTIIGPSPDRSFMKIGEQDGYEFYCPQSGGKAGKGFNVTGTIQLRAGGCIVKQFRFILLDPASRKDAMLRAKNYAHFNKP